MTPFEEKQWQEAVRDIKWRSLNSEGMMRVAIMFELAMRDAGIPKLQREAVVHAMRLRQGLKQTLEQLEAEL